VDTAAGEVAAEVGKLAENPAGEVAEEGIRADTAAYHSMGLVLDGVAGRKAGPGTCRGHGNHS